MQRISTVASLLRLFELRDQAISDNSGFQVMQAEALIADTARTARESIIKYAIQSLFNSYGYEIADKHS